MSLSDQRLHSELLKLRSGLPILVNQLGLQKSEDIKSWQRIIDGKVLPRLSPDFPLTVAICGGGSVGKSTLFNSLVKDRLSPSGGRSGINRRILVSGPSDLFRNKEFLATLFEPFGSESRQMKDKNELTVPGCPLYVLSGNAPRNMVLIDTPDIDTGAKGAYTNRDVVRQALEASDIMIYLFTNATYNNRDNTDFISQMLTGIGIRKCFLVYRIDSKLSNKDALHHAMTVARHLYGPNPDPHILGIYRTDEDNAVASEQKFMSLIPIRPVDIPIEEALKNLDPYQLRPQILTSIMSDVLKKSESILQEAEQSLRELKTYYDALQEIHQKCARQALAHFPMGLLMRRFIEIWLSTDPLHIRMMRKTGDVIGYPVKLLSSGVKWLSGKTLSKKISEENGDFKNLVESDLVNAATSLRNMIVSAELSGLDQKKSIPAHPAIFSEQEKIRQTNWDQTIERILSQKHIVTKLSEGIETELAMIAADFRKKMDFSGKIRQTFSAVLNILPATVAVIYILQTGDAAGAAGIKVKLTGIFGLNDLYALIAVPATTGLSKADRKQLEALLGPLAQAWLNDKFKVVHDLFIQEITGGLMTAAEKTIHQSEKLIDEIHSSIDGCREILS